MGWIFLIIVVVGVGFILFVCLGVHFSKEERKEKEAQEKKEQEEQAKRKQMEQEQLERFCNGLDKNPIITTAVPAIAKQCAQKLIERHRTEQYFEYGYNVIASNSHIEVLNIATIPYAQYGFPAIGTAETFKMALRATLAFSSELSHELSTQGIQVDSSLEQVIDYYTRERKPNYYLVFKIGSLKSW